MDVEPVPREGGQHGGEQRQQLQGVHPHEVPDAEVAPGGAPPDQRQPRPAVRDPDAVPAVGDQGDAEPGPDEAEHEPGPHCAGGGDVDTPSPDDQHGDDRGGEPEHGHGRPHHAVEGGVLRGRDVEVTGPSSGRLPDDDHHLDDAGRHHRPSRRVDDPAAAREQRHHPGERRGVEGERERELQRLEPQRLTQEGPLVDDGGDDQHHGRPGHRHAEPEQPRVTAARPGENTRPIHADPPTLTVLASSNSMRLYA